MYARVVGEGGVDPGYFLDKMSFIEVRLFLDGLNKRNRDAWEQTRILAYIIAQVNSTKQLDISNVLPLPWDNDKIETKQHDTVSDDDIKRLRAMAKKIEQQQNG